MLYWNTVNDLLTSCLRLVMNSEQFKNFRLVGGTSLSLQRGNRMSIDIDLFSDAMYGSINFEAIEDFFKSNYDFVDSLSYLPVAMGKSYRVGASNKDSIKIDVYYTDPFIFEPLILDGIRMAREDEILAMKADVIQRVGRKKDFWDIHELMSSYNVEQMLSLHERRYPYSHDRNLIIENMVNFSKADGEPDPICLKGLHWELIKLDIVEMMEKFNQV